MKFHYFFPESAKITKGKTQVKEDRFTAQFVKFILNRKIIQAVNFQSPNPNFSGQMIVELTLKTVKNGTRSLIFLRISKRNTTRR